RWNSRAPSRSSSAATARVTAGGDCPSCRAAAAKLPASATALNVRIESKRSILFLYMKQCISSTYIYRPQGNSHVAGAMHWRSPENPMPTPARPIRFYRFPLSGHSHRVELFLSLLGLRVEPTDVDLTRQAQKRPDFLAKNPFGQVPVI